MEIIVCNQTQKTYLKGIRGIDSVSFSVQEGEFVYLMGASGSGKSTLLKLLYGAEKATSGNIMVCGYDLAKMKRKDLYKLRREIGIVFQDLQLLKRKTVYENIQFALEIVGVPEENMDARIRQTLTLVELADKADCFPEELSGGQMQRVAIARALVNNPRILLADEPTGNLDPQISREIFRLFMRINRRGTTVILATHDQTIFQRFQHRALTMSDGFLVADESRKEVGSLQYDFHMKDFYIV